MIFLDSKEVGQIIKSNNDKLGEIANSLFTQVWSKAASEARMDVDKYHFVIKKLIYILKSF